MPLSPPFEMALVVNRDSLRGTYEGQLRLNWGDAPGYARRGGFVPWNGDFEEQDGNTTRRTGGRASKRVYMDHGLRRQGQVKFFLAGQKYGFIVGTDGTDVFFHADNAEGFAPSKGQRVSYLPLATPRGVQAKDVRLA